MSIITNRGAGGNAVIYEGPVTTAKAVVIVLLVGIFTLAGAGEVLAQVSIGGSGSWASSIADKGEGIKVGLLSLVAVALGIGGAWMIVGGAISGEINWRRVGVLGFCAVLAAALDQVVQSLVA